MSDEKLVNIARLMTTYNLEIEQLPDNLKCTKCKLVLKDACQLPCCCRFCRVCIDDMITRGNEFCPGDSEECGESLLSRFVSHDGANKRISRLTVKCPHHGCVYHGQLANIEQHLRECLLKSEECQFDELGYTNDKLAAHEMSGHLQFENRKHCDILILMIDNINKEIEMLKRRDEASSREIEVLKKRDEASSREIEILKHELKQKDGQIRSIMDQMINVQNDIKLIKEEKEDLVGQVKILTQKIELEIAERRRNDELDSARVIEYVDREISAVSRLIGSNKDQLTTEIQSVRCNIGLINQSVQSINGDICSVKSQLQSVQALVGLGQVDTSFLWLIDNNIDRTDWYRQSDYFTGAVYTYKYLLESSNSDTGTPGAVIRIRLRIYPGPNDEHLAWPFQAKVVIMVTDRDRREPCRSISLQCRMERPPNNDYRWSDEFTFLHSELVKAGLNLIGGIHVLCVIVPGAV